MVPSHHTGPRGRSRNFKGGSSGSTWFTLPAIVIMNDSNNCACAVNLGRKQKAMHAQ